MLANRPEPSHATPFRLTDILLSPEEELELQRLARARRTPRNLAERAEMILRSAAGIEVREIARQVGVWPKTVRLWRACWLTSPPKRLAQFGWRTRRARAPVTFTPEQVCAIMALACERL